jgi:NitT/TauT family transport system ATP-binding protein
VACVTALKVRIEKKEFWRAPGAAGHVVISGMSFDVAPREFVCILGPSGTGKTTMLNIIGGLDTAFEGEVVFSDTRARDRLAYVFQEPRLLPWRTLRDNVALALKAAGSGTPEEGALHWLDRVGLKGFANHFPGQASLGMQRRAALARAFAIHPMLMLMDEPFVSLDDAAARELRQLLSHLWEIEPVTILFVTHDVREAISLATRILVLSASPAKVVSEIPVNLSAAERANPATIETFRSRHFGVQPAPAPLNGSVPADSRTLTRGPLP